jgi:membrane protein
MSPAAPDSPTDIRPRGWWSVLKRTIANARAGGLTDWGAALTYYGVLALFPAFIALVAVLGLVGRQPETTDAILDIVAQVGSPDTAETVREQVEGVVANRGGAGALLGLGLIGALWSASGYIGAFARANNRVWEVQEGRPFWKLKPIQLLITLVAVLLVAAIAVMLVVSGSVAEAIGEQIGMDDAAVTAWQIAKWPVMLVVVIGLVALLYYATPNVKDRRWRWISPGAALAVVAWLVASAGFAFYVANFGSYNATYGALAGVIVMLIWLWITNVALLVGIQFDAELERERQIVAGRSPDAELDVPEREPAEEPAPAAADRRE